MSTSSGASPLDLVSMATSRDPSIFIANVRALLPALYQIESAASSPVASPVAGDPSSSFSMAFLQGIKDLHRSLVCQNDLFAVPTAAPLLPSPPLFPKDDVAFVSLANNSAAVRRIAQAGGSPYLSCPESPPSIPTSPLSLPSSPHTLLQEIELDLSKDSESFVSAVLQTDDYLKPAPLPSSSDSLSSSCSVSSCSSSSSSVSSSSSSSLSRSSFVLDFEHVIDDIAITWGPGSPLYPTGAASVYAASHKYVEETIKQRQQPANPAELSRQRLALLHSWSATLDTLSPQNKAAIWATCELSPLFGQHNKASFRSTVRTWMQDPDAHANSIRVMFGAIGYLKYNDVLKNQFLCTHTGEHIFRTFVFENPGETPRPTRVKKRTMREDQQCPIQRPPSTSSSSSSSVAPILPLPSSSERSSSAGSFVDVLAEAAVLALLEEEAATKQPRTSCSKRSRNSTVEQTASYRLLKRQRPVGV